ncbi:MAG: hypothetical protein LBM04_11690 [Opitutaceae bacterium]|jgi:polygalacturonase|nr:hypothetical protein [Opitutaceae bacterium]
MPHNIIRILRTLRTSSSRAILAAIFLGALAALPFATTSSRAAASSSELDWPEITSQTKPWTRWWWLGSIGTKQDFSSEMEKYASAGLGGLEITPIYGVRGEENRFTQYLSPQWMDLLDHVLDEARRLDLGVDMATGNGWPFGGPWVGPQDAARHVVTKTYTVKSGASLAETVAATDRPLVRVAGRRRVDISELTDPVASNASLQDLALDQVRFPRQLQLQALVAYPETAAPGGQQQKLDLTDKVDASSGKLDWTAPSGGGDWTLYAVFLGWHGKQVERAGPGGEGDVIDHFSSASLAKYLKRFDDAYAGIGGRANRLRAYFNDSYEVDDAAGESNWTPRFFDEFARRRGYDLRDELPAFFGRDTPEKNVRVMSDHRETISDLLLDEFTVPWAKWAASHNAIIRNQAHGSPANIIDLYAASGIPETEGENIVGMKLASSAAHVTGSPLTGAETATWLGEHWVSTLGDIKRRVDLMFLGGVNFNCYHGTAFSPPGEPWPGHLFYASVELTPANPLWADFAALNNYVARAQSFLQAGKPRNDILFYYPIHDIWSQRGHPIRDIWSQRDNRAMPHFSSSGHPDSAHDTAQQLLDLGYTFDFITDRLLAGVQVRDGALVTAGGARHQIVLVPETKLMPPETLRHLRRLAESGATIVFLKNFPDDVPGLGQLETRRADYTASIAALRGIATASSPDKAQGRVLLGGLSGDGLEDLEKLLARAGVARETLVDRGLHFERRSHDNGSTYFLLNRNEAAFEGWVPLHAGANTRAAALFDPMRAERGLAALRTGADGQPEVYLQLAPAESVIVKTFTTSATPTTSATSTPTSTSTSAGDANANSNASANGNASASVSVSANASASAPGFPYWKTPAETAGKTASAPAPLTGEWELRFTAGGPTLPAPQKMTELKSWTKFDGADYQAFSGAAVYRITFARPSARAAAWRLDLGKVAESARVTLNGRELAVLFAPPFQLTLTDGQLAAHNTLEITVTNLAANRIADLDRRDPGWKKFHNTNYPARIAKNRGPDGNFTAAAWTPRDSGLLGPVTLTPLERFTPAPDAPRSAPTRATASTRASTRASASARRLSITETGAVADGATINTAAIQTTIDRLASSGGGAVVVPRGVFVSGALDLKPGVNLHLEKDAVLRATTDMSHFPNRRTRLEGKPVDYTPALINAVGCDGLCITGEGTLDGDGRKIWDEFWTRRRAAPDQRNFPNMGIPRARLAFIAESRDVLIEGITFKDSQFWNCHLYLNKGVVVRHVRFLVPDDYRQAPSTDGIDVDSSQDVLIESCTFSVTDDCIALKGTKGPLALEDTASPPVERIRVCDCDFKRGPAVTLGSEATVVRDVVVENCRVTSSSAVLTFKLRPDTPQTYENIHYRNIVLENENGSFISIRPWMQYFDLKDQPPPRSTVRNITISGVSGRRGNFGIIEGTPGQTEIDGILFENINLTLRNDRLRTGAGVKNLRFQNVTINGSPASAPTDTAPANATTRAVSATPAI